MPDIDPHSNLDAIAAQAIKDIELAADEFELEKIRVQHLGRKSQITALSKSISSLAPNDRPEVGKQLTLTRTQLESAILKRRHTLKELTFKKRIEAETVDISLPARKPATGGPHPLTRTLERMREIFFRIGFEIAIGPEIEDDYHNFEALNIPANHPARAMQDTFYFGDGTLLRTHTSPVQIRYMETHEPPIRIVAPGRVYRCDSDITHTPMFHQIEGLVVDEKTTFSDLKGVLEYFISEFFEADLSLRFRPSYFPFTEPSAEVDISCVFCKGSGCNVCKKSGWLEVLGCGMVHPALYGNVGIDAERFTGYAFGMGVERFTMLRYGVDDIRLYFKNDLDMLSQFK